LIEAGAVADVVVLAADFSVRHTVVGGRGPLGHAVTPSGRGFAPGARDHLYAHGERARSVTSDRGSQFLPRHYATIEVEEARRLQRRQPSAMPPVTNRSSSDGSGTTPSAV
jgi:hypothetical protein